MLVFSTWLVSLMPRFSPSCVTSALRLMSAPASAFQSSTDRLTVVPGNSVCSSRLSTGPCVLSTDTSRGPAEMQAPVVHPVCAFNGAGTNAMAVTASRAAMAMRRAKRRANPFVSIKLPPVVDVQIRL